MPQLLSKAEIEKTLAGIAIPSRPQILVKLGAELAKEDPDPQAIVRLISVDVALSAAVLKTVNSPFFGLSNKTSSVASAVALLGMRSANQIVTTLVLKNSVVGDVRSLERFWHTSEKLAAISAYIATTMRRGPRDDAYSFGLFHDIGIPILSHKIATYGQTLASVANSPFRSLTSLENEHHATNHATLGCLIATEWCLPSVLCEAILYHHDDSIFQDQDAVSPQALNLVAIARLADYLNEDGTSAHSRHEWDRVGDQVLEHLDLSEGDCLSLRDELANLQGENSRAL